MSDTVIRVENLGKKYIIGHQKREQYMALRDVLADGAKSLGRQVLKPFGKRMHNPATEEFWALKDVSFEINQGDRVGIIGRNGAGKSTLLKILSRIAEPTSGRISIKGRLASLLEVGTGFHPELTGRENIYLNGAILGMSKSDIKRKFDEIVDFSGVEKFLDTPVKRYSSGMYVRLAFAVAANLEPEILVVDEVLAVGDAKFQQKCLGKMEDVGKEGRTVIFVSHNMSAVARLCSVAKLLEHGKLIEEGSTSQVVQSYLGEEGVDPAFIRVSESKHEYNTAKIFLRTIALLNGNSNKFAVRWKEKIKLSIELEVMLQLNNVVVGLAVTSLQGTKVFAIHHTDNGVQPLSVELGIWRINIELDNPLQVGLYNIAIGAHNSLNENIIFLVQEAAKLEIIEFSVDNSPCIQKKNSLVNAIGSWYFT